MNYQELIKKVEQVQKELEEIKKNINNTDSETLGFQDGQKVFIISWNAEVTSISMRKESLAQARAYGIGNMFKTEEEAYNRLRVLQAKHILKRTIAKYNKLTNYEFKENPIEAGNCYFMITNGKLSVNWHNKLHQPRYLYFKDLSVAKRIRKEIGDDIIKLALLEE